MVWFEEGFVLVHRTLGGVVRDRSSHLVSESSVIALHRLLPLIVPSFQLLAVPCFDHGSRR
jgi:hypothetical protein